MSVPANHLPRRDRNAGIGRQFDTLERMAYLRREYLRIKREESARDPDWAFPLFGPRPVSATSAYTDYRNMRMKAVRPTFRTWVAMRNMLDIAQKCVAQANQLRREAMRNEI